MNSGPAHSALGTTDASQPPSVMVAADGVCRTFGSGHTAVHALRSVSFTVDRGQLLIADEPTSQLDLETGRQIMGLLLSVVRSEGITALVATHDEALVDLADQVISLEDGSVSSIEGG
jgi:ABC-type ATPase involved in cell division